MPRRHIRSSESHLPSFSQIYRLSSFRSVHIPLPYRRVFVRSVRETGKNEGMILAIVLGAICGIVGFVPFIASLRLSRTVTSTSNFSHMAALLLGLLGSMAILFGAVIICAVVVRGVLVPFGAAEAIGLIVTAIGFGVYQTVRK